MGKRELVLILAFALVGVGVYQLTAPDTPSTGEGFSISRMLQEVRAEFTREDFKLDATRDVQQATPPTVSGLSVRDFRGELTIRGEERSDVSATVETEVYGADEPTTRALVEQLQVRFEQDGDTLRLVIDRPRSRRRTRTVARLLVPARLALKIENVGRLEVESVASLQMDSRAGDALITAIAGEVRGDHRDGELTIKGAGDLSLTTRGSVVRVSEHRGSLKADLTGGRLVSKGGAGDVKIEARRSELELEGPAGTVDVTASDGELTIRQPLGAVSFDGRRCDFSYIAGPAVALEASSVDAPIEAVLPQAGVTLDVAAEEGRVELPQEFTVTRSEHSEKMTGPVGGGGALWKLRTVRDDLRVRR